MSSGKRVLLFLAFVAVFVIFLTLIFGGGGSKTKENPKNPSSAQFDLVDYGDKNSEVSSLTDGVINGDDIHRQIKITVNRDFRRIDIIQGYQGNVIKSQTFANNQEAYQVFLDAISRTGFGKVRRTSVVNEAGVCPTGRRFWFELKNDNKVVSNTWNAACARGSSPANPTIVTNLFQQQITDYSKFTSGVRL